MSILPVRRYSSPVIREDLAEKMVFLAGPRQVGKTTLARSLGGTYLNWDDSEGRKAILARDWPARPRVVIFDEIHKYARWRNLVKGYYDTQKASHSFLLTGSARLDHYRKGGDSLLGRYHFHRLHPFSLSEVGYDSKALESLMTFGGFPEPLLTQNARSLRRWQMQRLTRVVREDLRDLQRVRDVSLIERMAEVLPERVGSPLSIASLARDLEVDFKTARSWIEMLEGLYYCYRIPPFGAPRLRAVRKEQKLYLWDWSTVSSAGARFENLVAGHLLKYCHFQEDVEGHRMELRFLRDVDKREVDFVVLRNSKPLFAVECKTGEKSLSPHIPYFKERTSIPKFYQVHGGTRHRTPVDGVEIIPFAEFCRLEKIP
jgi:predicted AAA+ superfamily ATPase